MDYSKRCYERSTWAISCVFDGEAAAAAPQLCRAALLPGLQRSCSAPAFRLPSAAALLTLLDLPGRQLA